MFIKIYNIYISLRVHPPHYKKPFCRDCSRPLLHPISMPFQRLAIQLGLASFHIPQTNSSVSRSRSDSFAILGGSFQIASQYVLVRERDFRLLVIIRRYVSKHHLPRRPNIIYLRVCLFIHKEHISNHNQSKKARKKERRRAKNITSIHIVRE